MSTLVKGESSIYFQRKTDICEGIRTTFGAAEHLLAPLPSSFNLVGSLCALRVTGPLVVAGTQVNLGSTFVGRKACQFEALRAKRELCYPNNLSNKANYGWCPCHFLRSQQIPVVSPDYWVTVSLRPPVNVPVEFSS